MTSIRSAANDRTGVPSIPVWAGLPIPPLPAPPTPLVGRWDEIESVITLLTGPVARLVTLTGPGGIGKTRLALEIAHRLAERTDDQLLFVSLAAVQREQDVVPAVLRAIGLSDQGQVPPLAALSSALRHSDIVLVLDNFEHVLGAAPDLAELLATLPRTRLLVTSRSLLHLRGEFNVPIPPLALPDVRSMETGTGVRDSAAVQLFLDRARAAAPGFVPAEADLLLIAMICRRLDGLPLAIELAAARSTHLSPAVLYQRLNQRLHLLTGGASDLPARHRTLRDTIAWSYALLTPAEQGLFRLLAVFQGGFTLDALEAIHANLGASRTDHPGRDDAGIVGPDWPIVDGLGALVNASLIRYLDAAGGDARYELLGTIRDYAAELLAASSEADVAREQHARWFLAAAQAQTVLPFMPDAISRASLVSPAQADILAALAWFEASGNEPALGRLAAAVGWIWWHRGEWRAGVPWLDRVWEDDAIRASLSSRELVAVGVSLGLILFAQTNDPARSLGVLTECLDRCQHADETYPEVAVRISLGWLNGVTGEIDAGLVHLEEALRLARLLPPSSEALSLTGTVLNNLATVLRWSDRPAAAAPAAAALDEARGLLQQSGNLTGLHYNLLDRGYIARELGDYPLAAELFRQALEQTWARGDRRGLVGGLEGVATVAVSAGHMLTGARLLGFVERERQSFGMVENNACDRRRWEAAIAAARTALGDAGYGAARREGLALPFEQAVAEAVRQTGAPARPRAGRLLTPREMEILHLLASGRSNREIAGTLFVGERTIESHLSRIYDKLGVGSRTAAIAAARARGLLDAPDGGSAWRPAPR